MRFAIVSGQVKLIEKEQVKEPEGLPDVVVIILILISIVAWFIESYYSSVILYSSALALNKKRKHTKKQLTILVDGKQYGCEFYPTSLEVEDEVELVVNEQDSNNSVIDLYALRIPAKGHLWTKYDMRVDKSGAERFIFKTVPKLFTFLLVVFLAAIASFNVVAFGAGSLSEALPVRAVIVTSVVAILSCLLMMKVLHLRADIPHRAVATQLFTMLGFETPQSVSYDEYNTSFIERWENKYNRTFPRIDDGTVFYFEPS